MRKYLIVLSFCFVLLLSACGSKTPAPPVEEQSAQTVEETEIAEPAPDDLPPESTVEELPPESAADDSAMEASRECAAAVDAQFMSYRASAAELYYTYLASVKSSSFNSELEAYNAAKELKSQLQECLTDVISVECACELELFDDYRLSNMMYVSSMIDVADKSMQYFDDGLTSTLSEFQEAVSSVETAYLECYSIQDQFLYSAGFSFDEIDEMLGNLE